MLLIYPKYFKSMAKKNYIYLILAALLLLLVANSIKDFIYLFIKTPVDIYFSKYFKETAQPRLDYSSIASLIEKGGSKLDFVRTRDFIRYDCENKVRLGGSDDFINGAPDMMTRIDGAWYVCLDRALRPLAINCTLLSFGIHNDYTFDVAFKNAYSCHVHSFDPRIEAMLFSEIRKANPKLLKSPVLKIDNYWTFYKIGLSDRNTNGLSSLQIGDMLDYASILKLINMENKVVDVLKIDIEGAERGFLQDFNMSYACKYVKQLLFETHANFRFNELVKLEECFYLFHRDTRFFLDDLASSKWGTITEFHHPKGFKLNLKPFKNDLNLAEYMFVTGELYFVNINFLV
jgi:hypothetical protein